MPPLNPIFKQTGKHEDNVSRAVKANNLSNKGLAKPPLTPLLHQDPGITNQSWWISTEPEHQGGIGEDKEEVPKEGT